jgi:hypothetical protein
MSETLTQHESAGHSPLPLDAEVLITIGANSEGMQMQVRCIGVPIDKSNPAHFFGQYLSDNFGFLLEQSMRLYQSEKPLAEANARASAKLLKLVGPDGERLN